MVRNKVQFQKGVSLNDFIKQYGTEAQCFDVLYAWRWTKGFQCPACGHDKFCQLTNRKLQQCNRCNRQTSLTAGTIFESTKLPLTLWFQGIYLITQDKKGISAMKLHRHLGISYNAAWRMKHKLMQVMMERDHNNKLSGLIELDDAYLGGGRASVEKPEFLSSIIRWVNTILGNLKCFLCSTYHAIRPKYAQRYLAEFQYRFNHRFDLSNLIPRLACAALRTPPMPENLLNIGLC